MWICTFHIISDFTDVLKCNTKNGVRAFNGTIPLDTDRAMENGFRQKEKDLGQTL